MPFFAKVTPGENKKVELPSLSQALMDLEIRQASYAGLDYWAFVSYGAGHPMSAALEKYLSSEWRTQIKFCLFTELARWGSSAHPAPLMDEHIHLMSRPEYLRPIGNRPIYFLGFMDRKTITDRWGSLDRLRAMLLEFRKKNMAAGNGNPYIVASGPFAQLKEWSLAGVDAIGSYSIGDPRAAGSYATLADLAQRRWSTLSKAGLPVVPTVMAGFDRRPRVEHPVPWEKRQRPGDGIQYYYEAPSTTALATHLEAALQFVSTQPTDQRAPVVLVYAWNENDEGGWLVPTLPCDTDRLRSLHDALAPTNQLSDPGCALK
ncbi:hypothetical protein [Bradyrhizobium sp. USDA 10063]